MLKTAKYHTTGCVSAFLTGATAAVLAFTSPLSAQSVSAPLSVTTFAGTAGVRQVTNGNGTAARFYSPGGLIIDNSGNLIVADTCNEIFRKITPAGDVTVFSGTPLDSVTHPLNNGSTDGTASQASYYLGLSSSYPNFDQPVWTIVGANTLGKDSAGNIYFADTLNDTIRRLATDGSVVTIAGSAGNKDYGDGQGTAAKFNLPGGVAVDRSGNVFVADTGNHVIRKIDTSGNVTTVAGTAGKYGADDGTGAAARFNFPSGIAVDASGTLYVADTNNHTIRKIGAGYVVTTLAGSPANAGAVDGSGTQARFRNPYALTVDSGGNVWVADTENHAIRKITSAGTVSTVAGTKGTSGSADGTGSAARFYEPYGITIDSSGTVYVADSSNDTIRKGVVSTGSDSLNVTEIPPTFVQVLQNSNVTMKIVATGSPSPSYQWSRNGAAISGATNATLTLTSVSLSDKGSTYSVTVTSGSLTFTSATTQLDVSIAGSPVPSVAIVAQPADRTVAAGQGTTFTVEATSSSPLSYQWKFNGTTIAGATNSTYTISSTDLSSAGSYTVTVTDGSSTVTTSGATLSVTGTATAPTITLQPLSQTVSAGTNVTFTVQASGNPAPTYRWQKNGVALSDTGSISGSGTASLTVTSAQASDAGSYAVVATNMAGSVLSNAATLTVNSATSNMGHIGNMSVLTSINAGENFSFGFYIGGSGTTGTTGLLMRAMGPTLGAAPFNIPGVLADPYMEFYNSSTKIAQNDNWSGDAQIAAAVTKVQAFPFVSTDSKDAAIYSATVDPSMGHSIKVSGVGTASGTVIAELYDTTSTSEYTATTPRLINVSLIKNVGGMTTLGFYIIGSTPVKLLIRAVGPSIGPGTLFNVSGVIADPQMALYASGNSSTPIATNNDWSNTSEMTDAVAKTNAFGLQAGSKDSAMVQTLNPGGYSVQVTAATGSTGIALVEIYEVPQ